MVLKSKIAFVLWCAAVTVVCGIAPATFSAETPEAASDPTGVTWTPVIMRPTVVPQVVQGSDNKYNLVYELILTNANKYPTELTQIAVFDADTGKEVQRVSGKKALGGLLLVPGGAPGNTRVPVGGTAVYWANLSFENAADVPKRLVHEVAFDTKDMFQAQPKHYSYRGAHLDVNHQKPVVIGSPLRGGKWVAIGGYCGVVGHRRTLLPVDNKQTSAQRYAIDWLRIDDEGYTTHGDKYANTSSPAYNQPIYAVADGTVVAVEQKFGEQKPFVPSGTDRYSHPAGNCIVQDIGNGLYGLYAHLKPGTIKVKAGDKVKRGDVIAMLGNSGNSTGPHLHFHVVDDRSVLGSNGVPYVFDKFSLVGEVGDLAKFFTNDSKALPQTIADSKYKGPHTEQLVREGHIVAF